LSERLPTIPESRSVVNAVHTHFGFLIRDHGFKVGRTIESRFGVGCEYIGKSFSIEVQIDLRDRFVDVLISKSDLEKPFRSASRYNGERVRAGLYEVANQLGINTTEIVAANRLRQKVEKRDGHRESLLETVTREANSAASIFSELNARISTVTIAKLFN
jgi:hypothetical protein